MAAMQSDPPEMPELPRMALPTNESLAAIPVHAYAVQLAIICGHFEPYLDDSKYMVNLPGKDKNRVCT